MTRSMRSAKQAGSEFEGDMAGFFAHALGDPRICRRARNGAKDRGDIHGLMFRGWPIVAECKSYASADRMAQFLREAEDERGNDDALVGVVIHKVRGRGSGTFAGAAEQRVTMTTHDFAVMLAGSRELVDERMAEAERRGLSLRDRVRAIGPDLDEFDDQEGERWVTTF